MDNFQMAKAISELKKQFVGDKEAMEAIFLLQEKLDHLFSVEDADAPESEEDFPLPKEIKNNPGSFAIFSDGACRGNPGPGAWGVMGQDSEGVVLFEKCGVSLLTTNNQMELEGAIKALDYIGEYLNEKSIDQAVPVFLYSDSRYVVDGMKSWIAGWKKRGWKKADNKIPTNLEQWKRLDEVSQKFSNLHFLWVKGHSGHHQNERCDEIANFALDQLDT